MLTHETVIKACLQVTERMDHDGNLEKIAIAIMPDHVHLLVTLGLNLQLEQTIRKWKTEVRRLCGWKTIRWQENFYDRRLRGKDRMEAFGRYMFLNPFRAKLISAGQRWPGWHCWKPEWFSFLPMVEKDPVVVDQWLQEDESPWEY